MRAAVFAVYRCGFFPRSALEKDNGILIRLENIISIIKDCRYGIHDLSRTELGSTGLPRFNMPFELGIFVGAHRFGNQGQRYKTAVILDNKPYQYLQSISDLNGVDAKAHYNDPTNILKHIRNWLSTEAREASIPTTRTLLNHYKAFEALLPFLEVTLNLEEEDMTFNDLCMMIETYIAMML